GARRRRGRAEPRHARHGRPAHFAARAAPGAPAGEEPHRRAEALPLPVARPGRDAWPLQGPRRRVRTATDGLPRLVRDPHLPLLPAAVVLSEAARRHRLDDLALLPPRHRGALDARPSPAPRCLTTSPAPGGSWTARTWPASERCRSPTARPSTTTRCR